MSFEYQDAGAAWLAPRRTGLLAWGMRCGKTRTALRAAALRNPRAGVLVVGPSVCRSVWRDEALAARPNLKVVTVSRATFRWPSPGEMVLTTYESTPEHCGVPPEGVILIADECHKIRVHGSAMMLRLRSMAWAVLQYGGCVWALTGTPVCHTPDDLYTLAGILQCQNALADDYAHFIRLWGGEPVMKRRKTAFGTWTQDIGARWHDQTPLLEATVRLSKIAHRLTYEQVADQLPEVSVLNIQVPLSRATEGLCNQALAAIHARGMSLDEAFSLACLKKTASFPQVAKARAAIALCKAPALVELIEDYEAASEPVVVASAHRAAIDGLGARPGWACINGDTSPRRRTDIQQALREGRLKGVGISIASAGVGIDLSAARHLIMADYAWGPGENEQAIARIMGPRQTRPVTITYLQADHPLEDRLRHIVAVKSRSSEGVERLCSL